MVMQREWNKLSRESFRTLRNRGFNDKEIAQYFGVTPSAVHMWKRRHVGEWEATPGEAVKGAFPWRVTGRHVDASPKKLLRDHAIWIAGGAMSEKRLARLLGFYRKLRDGNLVVAYDPAYPPTPDCTHGGWAYLDKEPRDGNLIIRVNEHALPLTVEQLSVWEFPEQLPVW